MTTFALLETSIAPFFSMISGMDATIGSHARRGRFWAGMCLE
jgi:hypothetical protein